MNAGIPAHSFKDLRVWQKSHAMVLEVYRVSSSFPRHEIYGLTSQLRRAAVSVPANIAEGFRRRTKPDKVKFLNIAQGSLEETRYFMILALDLKYTTVDFAERIDEIGRMLDAYMNKILPIVSQKID